MKKLNLNWLCVMICAALCVNLSSCGDEPAVVTNTENNQGTKGDNSGNGDDNNGGDQDDDYIEGVVTLRLFNNIDEYFDPRTDSGIEEKVTLPNGDYSIYLYMNSHNNFKAIGHYNENHAGGSLAATGYNSIVGNIVDIGERKMNKISTVPTSGWVEEAAVLTKHSYLFRATGFSRNDGQPDFTITNYKIVYVVDWILNKDNEIIGAIVQYVDWKPEEK